jgi:hypothetical protein
MGFASVLFIDETEGGAAFLYRFAADGTEVGDTWHASVGDTREQANYEFRDLSDWCEVPIGVCDIVAFAASMFCPTDQTIHDLLPGLVREGREGWIGLWAIIWLVKRTRLRATSQEIQDRSLQLIALMLDRGFFVASFAREEYVRWGDQRPESVVRQIKREWDALGREPNLGDIAWFRLSQPS